MPTRSPATRSTPASTSSSPTRSIASRRTPPYSIERSYFPSLVERSETFVAYVYRGYWIDIGTPEKYVQVHRDIMDGTFHAAPFAGAPAAVSVATDGAHRGWRDDHRAVLHRRRRGRQGGRADRPVYGDRPPVPCRGSTRTSTASIVWANSWIGRDARRRGRDPRPQLPHRPQRVGRATAACSATSRS